MTETLEDLAGHWAEIHTGHSGAFGGLAGFHVGFVEEVTEYAVLLRKIDGEVLFLPRGTLRQVKIVDPEDTSEAGTLLRASSAPDSESLLRPASHTESTTETLLRPSSESEE